MHTLHHTERVGTLKVLNRDVDNRECVVEFDR